VGAPNGSGATAPLPAGVPLPDTLLFNATVRALPPHARGGTDYELTGQVDARRAYSDGVGIWTVPDGLGVLQDSRCGSIGLHSLIPNGDNPEPASGAGNPDGVPAQRVIDDPFEVSGAGDLRWAWPRRTRPPTPPPPARSPTGSASV